MEIRIDESLTRRVAVDPSGMIATVHLCAAGTCRLCPEQTAANVLAELQSQLVLAGTTPDWTAIDTAVDALRPTLDRALCERAVPEFRSSRGVPADMAETSDVLPAFARLPPPDLDGTAVLAAVPAAVPAGGDPDQTTAGHAQPDDGRSPAARWVVRQGWLRTGVLALIVVAALGAMAAWAGPAAVHSITTPDGDSTAEDQGGTQGGRQGGQQDVGRPDDNLPADQRTGGRSGSTGGPSAAQSPSAAVFYASCAAAIAAGVAPITRGQPGYRRELDRDSDGIACDTALSDPSDPGAGGDSASDGGPAGGQGNRSPAPPPETSPPPGGGAEPTTPPPSPPPPATTEPPAPDPTPVPDPTQDPGCVLNAIGVCVIGGGGTA